MNNVCLVKTASAFLLLRQILQNGDMPRQKPQHLPTAEANFERCRENPVYFNRQL